MGVATRRGATTLQDIFYARAATGRISSIAAARAEDTWSYAYDDLDRLVAAASAGNATNPTLNQAFAYDATHNMTANSQVGWYAYPASGSGSVRPHAVTSAGPYAYTYDAAGNTLSKQGGGVSNLLEWNADNKLARVLVGGLSHQYVYDANHQRVMTVVPLGVGIPDKVTVFAGEIEVDDQGVWTKAIHEDVKRRGVGPAAQAFSIIVITWHRSG